MVNICDADKCTGCGGCVNTCPRDAIKLVEGENGFVYPEINSEQCIECGLCVKKCPSNNPVEVTRLPLNVYAAWNRDKRIRKCSTSGGIFALFAEEILSHGGVVVGAAWGNSFEVNHIIVDNPLDLHKLYGSKYIQSYTGEVYRKIAEYLNSGRIVVFSGTPCQNHALKLFLGRNYDKLILIDLVCHGVPSYNFFARYLQEHKNKRNSTPISVRLRHKTPYWDFCNVTIDFENGDVYSVPTVDDTYFTLFNLGYSLRHSCHECRYTSLHRESDITLMDYWNFVPKNFKMGDYNKGVSCLFINTEKGQSVFSSIQERLVCEKRSIEDALKSNKCLKEPFSLDRKIEQSFWDDYKKGLTVEELHKKYIKNPYHLPSPFRLLFRRLKRRYRWIVKK